MKPVSKPFKRRDDLLAGAQFADSYCMTVSGQSLDAIGRHPARHGPHAALGCEVDGSAQSAGNSHSA